MSTTIIALLAAFFGAVGIGFVLEPYTLTEFILVGALSFSWGILCSIIRYAIVNPWPDD